MRRTIPQRVNPLTFYTMDTAVPKAIKSLPTVARQTHLAVSSWGLAFSMGIVGALTCQPHAVAALSLNSTNFFAAKSSASLLQVSDSPADPNQVLALPRFTTTDLPLQLGSGQPSPSSSARSELSRLRDGLVADSDASGDQTASVDPEQVTALSLQFSPSNSSGEGQAATSNSAQADASLKEASVPTELSKIIASLPTLNGKAHRSLALAQPTKVATTRLESLAPLVAVSSEPAPLTQPATEDLSSSTTGPSEASEQSKTLAQGFGASDDVASSDARIAQDTVAAIPEQRPAVNLSPNADLSVPVAKRTVFPQLPMMELPPLASADTYLPSGSGENSSFPGRVRFISPARGVLTSGYGPRWGRMHRGIDIAGPVGTTIMASAPGVIASAGWNSGGYGNLVEVLHPDGSLTLYAHNSRIVARRGQQVQQGQKIAEMGSTGRSTGPHLHFEIHPAGRGAVNPMIYISRS